MGSLSEATFAERVEAGCTACGGKKLVLRAYVEGNFALLGGEPTGRMAWAYKGETFVDGVFEIKCAACARVSFADPSCPRCHAPDGLDRALESENAHPVPTACPTCGEQTLTYRAFVPATVAYEGRRADKAQTRCGLYDEGFHGLRTECGRCGPFAQKEDACPVCDAPGSIRPAPG